MDEGGDSGQQPVSDKQLNEITFYAERMMTIAEICTILDLDKKEFRKQFQDKNNQLCRAFNRGRLKAKAEIHHSIITCAKQGSHPAHTMAQKIIDKILKQDENELDDQIQDR